MLRLSNHFLLLDFLYDQSTIDSVVYCGDLLAGRIQSIKEGSEEFLEGRYFCDTILEPLVERHGPISIGAGLWFNDLPQAKKAHYNEDDMGPHKWKCVSGGAADIVVHSWVNQGGNPKYFPDTLPGSNIEYHRALKYDGSEFCCLASRSAGNKFKSGQPKWDRLKEQANAILRPVSVWKTDWRRDPYTHSHGSKLKHNVGYDGRLRSAEASWTGKLAGEPGRYQEKTVVYGRTSPKRLPLLDHSIVEVPKDAFEDHPASGRKLCKPWHVRVSRNFVLLDFCRNERMFERKMVTVPPLTLRTANTVIKVARMFGEVLDDVKKRLGNISVVRGMEPEGFVDDASADEHRWIPGEGRSHSIEFVTPKDPKPGYRDLLRTNVCAVEVCPDPVYGGDRVRVGIRDFTPSRCYTSATAIEYAWAEE